MKCSGKYCAVLHLRNLLQGFVVLISATVSLGHDNQLFPDDS